MIALSLVEARGLLRSLFGHRFETQPPAGKVIVAILAVAVRSCVVALTPGFCQGSCGVREMHAD